MVEGWRSLINISIQAIFAWVPETDLVSIIKLMVQLMREIGQIIKYMVKESQNGTMVEYILENGKMVILMVRASIAMLTAGNTKATTKMGSSMAKAPLNLRMEEVTEEFGLEAK